MTINNLSVSTSLFNLPVLEMMIIIAYCWVCLSSSHTTIQTCTVYPLAMSGGGGISGLNDPLMKGTHLTGAVPPHHLQQIHDVSALKLQLLIIIAPYHPPCHVHRPSRMSVRAK